MARLNEAPAASSLAATTTTTASGETLDSLKRRFIRQNRELAKCNSSQSLQIRNLQLESQRLLSENLELREQLLQIQNEMQRTRRKAAKAEKFNTGLQARLAELASFVNEMGSIDEETEVDGEVRELRRPQASLQGQWRERIPLTEAMRENQMPTIAEDKLFPRRTLDASEIHSARLSDHSSNGSPDLGPPPVAHIDYEDPVKQASPRRPESPSEPRDEFPEAGLPMNLEVRRKRKDTQLNIEVRRHSILANSPAKAEGEPSSILRVGAKRKLADRDLEVPAIRNLAPEEFEFSRKAENEGTVITADADKQSSSKKPTKPTRKILGEKSANMSPRKTASKAEKESEKGKDEKPASDTIAIDARSLSRGRRASSIPVPSPPHDSTLKADISFDEPSGLRPVTPATADIFSPSTSQPSTGGNLNCDTPPPGDLSSLSTTSMTSESGRQSRRARSAVNYAEPSLVSKMRRPSKEMADAVTGLRESRQVMSVSTERKSSRSSVSVKKEAADSESWKSASTTSNAPSNAAIGSPLEQRSTTESKQLSLAAVTVAKPADPSKPSTSSAALSALIAESKKRRASLDRPSADLAMNNDLAAATKRLEELDMYNDIPSSPEQKPIKPRNLPAKGARRHTLNNKEPSDQPISNPESKIGTKVVAGTTAKAASRRKSMMI